MNFSDHFKLICCELVNNIRWAISQLAKRIFIIAKQSLGQWEGNQVPQPKVHLSLSNPDQAIEISREKYWEEERVNPECLMSHLQVLIQVCFN